LFIPCGRLSWLPISFLLHVKYILSYRNYGLFAPKTICSGSESSRCVVK